MDLLACIMLFILMTITIVPALTLAIHQVSSYMQRWFIKRRHPMTFGFHVPDDLCTVCLENIKHAEYTDLIHLYCNHWFHKRCIYRWQEESKSCPNCRSYVNLPQEYYLTQKGYVDYYDSYAQRTEYTGMFYLN
ncbi:hypothetical protein KR044_000786 [Drosophila immigrans]|nr:hypothetical protein KR044_000786 [Drosophila immigrans]